MASANTVLKKLINVNGVVVESYSFFTDIHDVKHLRIQVRPNKWHQKICPFCGRRCPGYDQPDIRNVGEDWIWEASLWRLNPKRSGSAVLNTAP